MASGDARSASEPFAKLGSRANIMQYSCTAYILNRPCYLCTNAIPGIAAFLEEPTACGEREIWVGSMQPPGSLPWLAKRTRGMILGRGSSPLRTSTLFSIKDRASKMPAGVGQLPASRMVRMWTLGPSRCIRHPPVRAFKHHHDRVGISHAG